MRWIPLVLSLAACAHAPAPRPPAARARQRHRRPRAAPAPPPTVASLCAPLRASSHEVIRRAFRGDVASATARWPVLTSFDTCLDAGRGAWALRLDAVREQRIDGALELEGSWSLVYAAGADVTAIRPWSEGATGPEINLACAEHDECTAIAPPVAFDHDGDGVAEVSVVVERARPMGASTVASGHGRLWTFRDGQIDRYGPARDLVVSAHRDGDGDGRPDLFTYGPYAAEAPGPCGRRAWPVHGPALMAHSLGDGGFSLTDVAARASLARACAPTPLAARTDAVDAWRATMESGARAVVCARLSGRDATSALRESRAAARSAASRCHRGAPDDWDVLGDWARTPPWVSLP